MSQNPQDSSGQQPANPETTGGSQSYGAEQTPPGSAAPYGSSSAPSAQSASSASDPYQPSATQPYGDATNQPAAPYSQHTWQSSQSYGQQPPQDAGYGQQPGYGAGYDPTQAQGYGSAPQYGAPTQPGSYPQQAYPGQVPAATSGQPMSASDERLWGTLAHISIPFFGFIGPLIAYLAFKDRSAWLKQASTEALNFSILYTGAQIISGILTVVLIGAILMPLIWIGGLVLCIMAAIASNKGELYRYPVNWRLVK